MEKEYYLGFDMGTNSVGWAVTDTNYNLMRARGKDLWGVREFDEASTAVERRSHRISRRRRQRQQVRIGLLKEYFDEEIRKIDKNFYERLENSKYYLEDKDEAVRSSNALFDDDDFKDADYYRKYKTIFHLRADLIENEEPHDVRLVYLALLNMFKHRGHFLLEGEGNSAGKIDEIYKELCEQLFESEDIVFESGVDISQIESILTDKKTSRTVKSEKLMELLGYDKKNKSHKKQVEICKLLCGLKGKISDIFSMEEQQKIEISLSEADFDEKLVEIESQLTESQKQIIFQLKQIYDTELLAKIMKGYKYLSQSRVADYEKHNKDLKKLKGIYKKYLTQEQYDSMFRDNTNGSYSAYVNSTNCKKKQRRGDASGKIDDFYKRVKTEICNIEDEAVKEILEEIENGTFMPKQLTFENGVIPNQVHLKEMEKILSNAEKYLPFLKNTDENGLTVSERILKLFKFHIPYYIGPVSENSKKNGGNGWVVRTEGGPVLPWNIEQKIDYTETSKKFIENLIRHCTYISDEKVLPKSSLIYEKFCVLNEINSLCVDNERISVEMKQDIFNDLFLTGKRVTKSGICKYLKSRDIIKSESQISGIDININNYLSSWGKFLGVFGDKLSEDRYIQMAEDIIYLSTVFGDSRKMLKKQITEKYGKELNESQINRIAGMKFKDWGRISRKFLEMEGVDKETGEVTTIIRVMWENNYNLMEVINSSRFDFKEKLQEISNDGMKVLSEIEVEDLDDMYFSAPVKRMVWQTIKIIKEVEKILGGQPKKLFIEMTRTNDEKLKGKRIDSRKKQFLDLYRNVKDETKDWKEIINTADTKGTLRSKKMYLYLSQMGRCMYTGNEIDLNELFDDNKYDIDHIYPRHFVKDDNINNNLVLVEKGKNIRKSDNYPIDKDIRDNLKVRGLWKALREKNLITEEKYKRLTDSNPFTDEQRADFIARQLVETSQGTKGVSDILTQALPNTEIVYAKASNVSKFRDIYKLYKSRTVNDFHHAHDAYLNIVVGNVYLVKFTRNPINFIKKEYNWNREANNYNLDKMFSRDVRRGDETAWIANHKNSESDGDEGTIVTVKKVLGKNTPIITRLNFEGNGAIAKEMPTSAKKAKDEGYIPLKTNDEKMRNVERYGGYKAPSTAYFFLVEHEEKGKKIRTIEALPVYLRDKVEKDATELERYCIEDLKIKNPDIRMRKIKIQSLVKCNGYYIYISGKTNNQYVVKNAVSLCLDQKWVNYIKKIDNYIEKGYMSDDIFSDINIQLYDILSEKYTNGIFAKRPNYMGDKLLEGREKFVELTLEEQCTTLSQIIGLSALRNVSADLKNIGGSKSSGVMMISKNITGYKEFVLINQSVTGVYSNKIDLLKA